MTWQEVLPFYSDPNNPSNGEIRSGIRAWRNRELAASDWTQLPDVALTSDKAQAWAQYRHELREMLKQSDDPKLIVFPEPPK